MSLDVDATNSCIPLSSCNLVALTPPLPSVTRGEPTCLDGQAGRANPRPVLLYACGRLVVVREMVMETANKVQAFVYRGHTAHVTCAKFSPSGCYIASADMRGKLRVWSYDNEEHLCKLDLASALAGPIRDLCWDEDSKRICLVGDGNAGECARVIQWDTGVTCGELAQHSIRNRAVSCSFRPTRPLRIATGGGEDAQVYFNAGPPFTRVVFTHERHQGHARGAVHCVRYNRSGTRVASVGTDKSVCFYEGETLELMGRIEHLHEASIYSCAWSNVGDFLLTCSADGTVKLVDSVKLVVVHTWDVAHDMLLQSLGSTGDRKTAKLAPLLPDSKRFLVGGMQMGCTFLHGDIPVSVSLNGQISILPVPPGIINGKSRPKKTPETQFLTGHKSAISSFAIDHANGIMFTGDTDGVICNWDLNSACAVRCVHGRTHESESAVDVMVEEDLLNKVHHGAIVSMVLSHENLMSAGWDDVIRWTKGCTVISDTKIEAQPIAMAEGNELVVVLTVNGLLLVKHGHVVSDLIPTTYNGQSVCVSSDGTTVYVGGDDFSIHIYFVADDGATLSESRTLSDSHLKPVYALCLSNDGSKLASADVRDICVWNVSEKYAPIIGKSRWCFHTQKISCLSWSNDDSVLASGGSDDSIYFWSLRKKTKRVHYPFAHRGGVTALEFLKKSPDGKMVIVSAGNDGCVNQWDVTDECAIKFA